MNTTIAAGGVKLTVTDINGAFVLPGNGIAGVLTIGSIALTDDSGDPLAGISIDVTTVTLRINTTGGAIDADVNGNPVVFTADEGNLLSVGGTLTVHLTAGVALDLTGGFFFEKSSYTDLTQPVGMQTVSTIKVAVSGVGISLTAGSVTVAATDINGAFILTNTGVAGKLTVGHFEVTGVDNLTVDITSVFVQINTTGAAVDATVDGQRNRWPL